MLDRTTSESAAKVFGYLFPHPAIRHKCMQALADSITTAHSEAPHTWSITLFPDAVRLNIGRIEALAYFANTIHCIVDAKSVPAALRQLRNVELIGSSTFVMGKRSEGRQN